MVPVDVASLYEGYATSRAVTRAHARSFYLASAALGPARRRAAFAVYAFCRRVDDAIDEAVGLSREELRGRIDALRAQLQDTYGDAPLARDPPLLALRDTVRRFAIEPRAFEELIEGVAMDVDTHRYPTLAALDLYCYRVAGTVGLMMARVFGTDGEDALAYAVDLGKAMQYTNILRDVREDLVDKGRIYLPADRMAAHGVDEASLRAPSASAPLRRLAVEMTAHARELYRSADRGIPRITSHAGRTATRIMRNTYSEILRVLEARDWDMLGSRAVVSRGEKGRALVASVLGREVTL